MLNKKCDLQSFSKKELQLIIEALLFSSSVDICASWYKEDNLKFLKLAKKIRKNFPKVVIENVYLYEDDKITLHDEHSKEISTFFPEINKKAEF